MQVHSRISFIPWIFGGNKLIGCADITRDVRYGPELKEAGTGYVTEHWNTQIEDVVWLNMPIRITSGFSNHDIKTAEREVLWSTKDV